MPLVGIGVCVSLQFGFLQSFKRSFRYDATETPTPREAAHP
jgi:hypothetical protein